MRRDLRLHDHPALGAASETGRVLPVFVLDPVLLESAGAPRVAFLYRTLRALDEDLRRRGGRLALCAGRPEEVVPRLVAEVGASAVHISEDFGPYGKKRDRTVEKALGRVPLVRTGSPYAVSPKELRASTGTAFRVFSAFARAWAERALPAPCEPEPAKWAALPSWCTTVDSLPPEPALPRGMVLPLAGEAAGLAAWEDFRSSRLASYEDRRDRVDLAGTSHLSVYIKWGSLHARTLLASLGPADKRFRQELAWREFYASVLDYWPESARQVLQPRAAGWRWDNDEELWQAWAEGQTGYPLVDAAMRQLLAQGWVHNRARMVTASFLVNDLHLDWRRGARHFMRCLVDGDLASNQHGWQWVAGTGTDPAPYPRIFNPVAQARRFDPEGAYVRRWVPALAQLYPPAIFEPWRLPAGPPAGYPAPVVDHSLERLEALRRRVAHS